MLARTKTTHQLTSLVKTKEEWMEALRAMSIDFLAKQLNEPIIANYMARTAGVAWSEAIHALIQEKKAAGATLGKRKVREAVVEDAEVDSSRVELVPYGGKGGMLRIVHPKEE